MLSEGQREEVRLREMTWKWEEGKFFFYFKRGILVFSHGLLAKMDPCSLAKMRPFIVIWPN